MVTNWYWQNDDSWPNAHDGKDDAHIAMPNVDAIYYVDKMTMIMKTDADKMMIIIIIIIITDWRCKNDDNNNGGGDDDGETMLTKLRK